MACMCLTLIGSLIWLDCVGGMVLLNVVAKASLMLSFDRKKKDNNNNIQHLFKKCGWSSG